MKTVCSALMSFCSLALLAGQDDYVLNKTTEAEESHSGVALGQPAGGDYSQEPFALQYAGSSFFSLQTAGAAVASGTVAEHAMTDVSNYQFRISAADRHLKLDFDAGSYNWLSPFGSTWATPPAIDLMRTDHSTFDRTSFVVHGGTTYWPAVRFAGTALVEDRFVLDGGTHTFGGALDIPYRGLNFYGKAGASTYRFDVTNGANVTIGGGMTIGQNSASGIYGTTVDKDIYLTVTEGSTLTLNSTVMQKAAGHHHVLIANSTVVNGNNFQFGPQDAGAAALITTDTLITNSTYSCSSHLRIYSGDVRFVDSTVGSSTGLIQPGWFSGARTTVDFVNCTTSYGDKNSWHDWPREAGSCDLNIYGGTFSANYVHLAGTLADNGTGTVTVAENANVTIATLRMGPRWGGLATLNVRSGTVAGSFELGGKNNNGSVVGGVGVINLSGGEIRSSSMTLGNSAVVSHASYASHPGTNLLHVTGGRFADTATRLANAGNFVVCENASARPSRIALDGGEMCVNKLYGGAGAQANGGSSWAAFEADGGKLVAPFAASSLLYGFDEAALGSRGLTVVSDSGCTIAQNFSDKPGSKGRLVLAGRGVKTLTGEDSRESVLVAAEGSVVFAATARHFSDVIVTNGASVAFAGAAGSGMIGDLTLGDDTTGGQLVLEKDVPIAVGGSLVVNHAQFALGEGFALNTTSTVFSVSGGVSEESIGALNESTVSGLPSGAAFEFLREAGQPGDPTLVKLAVRAANVIVVEATEGSVTDACTYAYATADSLVGVVSAGAALTLSGEISKGSIAKQGAGTMYLTNEANRFLGSVVLYDGRLSVSSMLALGYAAGGVGVFSLRGGTLELADAADPAMFPYRLDVNAEASDSAAVIIKTDTNVVMHDFTVSRGAFIKRGAGDLVMETAGRATLTVSHGASSGDIPKARVFFDDDGTVPSCWYGGATVAEGDLVLRGTSDDAEFYAPHNILVGMPTKDGTVQPSLTVDHAKLNQVAASGKTFYIGGGFSSDNTNTFVESARVVLTNGSFLNVNQVAVNLNCDADAVEDTALVADSSTVYCNYLFGANSGGRKTCSVSHRFANGSALYANVSWGGVGSMTFSGSTLARNESLEPMTMSVNNESPALNFKDGSLFCCNDISRSVGDRIAGGNSVFTFDNSEWRPSATGSFDFGTLLVGPGTTFKATGRGLVLAPAAGATYTFGKKLQGTGGLVKRGEGTLVFPMTNLVATGEIVVEAGMLDLDGTTAEGRTFSGSGAIRNGTLTAPVIKVSKDGAGLDLGATALSGRVRVDFSEYGGNVPLNVAIPVARVSGTVDLSKWRGVGIAMSGVRSAFTVESGVVLATIDNSGMLLIVQ